MLAGMKKAGKVVIGVKQVTKAVNKGLAKQVLLATDVPEGFVDNIKALCETKGIECQQGLTRKELGKACGIDCEASAAAILRVQ